MLRALTALITVWCLGCSAFDPLLCRLAGLPAAARKMCDPGEEAGLSVAAPSAVADHAPGVRATPTDDGRTENVLCGCQSCTAPAPPLAAFAVQPPTLPRIHDADWAPPPSLAREPLVPPPQRAA